MFTSRSYLKGGEGIDYFDVGTELVGIIYTKAHHDDALLAAMLLQVYGYFLNLSTSFYSTIYITEIYRRLLYPPFEEKVGR